jgi:hypothetical protein
MAPYLLLITDHQSWFHDHDRDMQYAIHNYLFRPFKGLFMDFIVGATSPNQPGVRWGALQYVHRFLPHPSRFPICLFAVFRGHTKVVGTGDT